MYGWNITVTPSGVSDECVCVCVSVCRAHPQSAHSTRVLYYVKQFLRAKQNAHINFVSVFYKQRTVFSLDWALYFIFSQRFIYKHIYIIYFSHKDESRRPTVVAKLNEHATNTTHTHFVWDCLWVCVCLLLLANRLTWHTFWSPSFLVQNQAHQAILALKQSASI